MKKGVSPILIQKTELPPLTAEQLEVLGRFAWLKAGTEDIRRSLAGVFDFELGPHERVSHTNFKVPVPGIAITRKHINNALEKKRLGLISERDLVYWATMLLINDAYEPDPNDEDFVAEWLNDISYDLDAG